MAIDRQGYGLATTRIFLGVFFLFEGIGKLQWFTNAGILDTQLQQWLMASAPGSISRWYLEHVAMRGTPVFARLVPLGELSCGLALITGFWTPLFAFVAFLMALNFHIASGAIFGYRFLTNGYGLPVLGPTLGLAIGGVRQRWSVRG